MSTGTVNMAREAIDLTSASEYADGEHEQLIREGLAGAGMFGDGFLYSVFHRENIGRVLSTGMTRDASADNVVYAFRADQLIWDNGLPNCLKTRCKEVNDEPAIAVYDRSHLKPADVADSEYGYAFRHPQRRTEALRGIVELII